MDKVVVQPGQTLVDISIQHLGSMDGVAALAQANGLPLTGSVSAGQILVLPTDRVKKVVKYFLDGRYVPAVDTVIEFGAGVGFWVIEDNLNVQ